MQYFKIFLLIIPFLFLSCTSTKKPTVVVKTKPKTVIKTKKEIKLNLDQSLKKLGAKVGDPIFIRIFKTEKILELWIKKDDKFYLVQTYPICAYSGALGPKLKQGDKQSPEGFYTITKNQLKPNSKYHLALNIGFPNQYDKYQNRTGTYLMIHGKCSSTGCYAIRNKPIEEVYKMVQSALENGQSEIQVHIFPFKMTEKNMKQHTSSIWYPFWVNLKLGYDIFEKYKIVPIIRASEEKYRFFMKKAKG